MFKMYERHLSRLLTGVVTRVTNSLRKEKKEAFLCSCCQLLTSLPRGGGEAGLKGGEGGHLEVSAYTPEFWVTDDNEVFVFKRQAKANKGAS